MPQLRKDPIIGRWVIISIERSKRPRDYNISSIRKSDEGFCPFCAGNESSTSPEVLAYREPNSSPNGPGWRLRVVPNKFPALKIEGTLDREGEGIYDLMNGVGAHEVIIESPNHDKAMADLSPEEMENVLNAYRERMHDLKRDIRFRYILVFKNHGAVAGASLEHSHSQLIALPIVPRNVAEEIEGTRNYYQLKERCIFCDMIRQETREGSRIVLENENFLVICPFAPRFPFETWILPKTHKPNFETLPKEDLTSLSRILSRTLKKLAKGLNNPPYNFILHTNPINNDKDSSFYHWHFEIMPTLTRVAGFEWGTGFYINHTAPENAAEHLRNIEE